MTNERAQHIVDASDEPPVADHALDADDASELTDETVLDEVPVAASIDEGAPTAELDDEELSDTEAEDTEGEDEESATLESQAVADVSDDASDDDSEDDADDGVADESLPQLLEALLFVADEPVAPAALARALERTPGRIRRGLDDLADSLRENDRGVRLQQGPDGAQLVTAPEAATAVELFLGLEANRRLSNAALETLAIIAYRQPVTRHVIDTIRGVSSDGAVATLRARGLIEGVGRAPGPGRPLLFATTTRFLEHFGLERPDELPPLPDDVQLPPEETSPLMDLEAAVDGEVEATAEAASEAEIARAEPGATLEGDESIEDLAFDDDLDTVDEDEEFDELDDDSELEISGDLDDLSRAAGAALATPGGATEAPDGPPFGG